MAKVYAFFDGVKEFYGVAMNNRELYSLTDDIESLGLEWDFDLM